MFEMHADLVRAPRFRPAFEKAQFSLRGEQTPRGLGRSRPLAMGHGHPLAVDRMPCDGGRDHAGRGARFPPHHREVNFLRGAFRELARQCGVGRVVFGQEDAAARVLVQPVHHARPRRGSSGREPAGVVQHGVDQGAGAIPHGGVHDQPRRFVQAEEILVFVEDFERDVLRLDFRAHFLRRRFLRAYLVARADARGGLGGRAIDLDQPRGDGALPARAAEVGPGLGQPAIEARGGLFGGFAPGWCAHVLNAGEDRPSAQGLPLPSFPR